jgi:hypothetical protein
MYYFAFSIDETKSPMFRGVLAPFSLAKGQFCFALSQMAKSALLITQFSVSPLPRVTRSLYLDPQRAISLLPPRRGDFAHSLIPTEVALLRGHYTISQLFRKNF